MILPYETLRIVNWIFEFLTSGLGITAFIALITMMLPMHTIDSSLPMEERKRRVIKNDARNRRRRTWSIVLLVSALAVAVIRYIGMFNVADVFNGEYKYVGQTLNGKADGKGKKYTLKDSLIYEGEFVANNFDGKGSFYWFYTQDDGSEITKLRYEGDFKAGVYEGEGKQYYANEVDEEPVLKYEGTFSNGEYNGGGRLYYYADDSDRKAIYINTVFDCEWKNGLKNGEGEYTKYNANGDLIEHYKGNFSNDLYEGVGTWEFLGKEYNYIDGKIVFRGLFEAGNVVEGIYYDINGSVVGSQGDKTETELVECYQFPGDNSWE